MCQPIQYWTTNLGPYSRSNVTFSYLYSGQILSYGGLINGPSVYTYINNNVGTIYGPWLVTNSFVSTPEQVIIPGTFYVYWENDWLYTSTQVTWWTQVCQDQTGSAVQAPDQESIGHQGTPEAIMHPN